jgi:alkyl hydroperoxide reductase subunit AhpC
MNENYIPPDNLPNYGFVSQAIQCNKVRKYNEQCWGGCVLIAGLKYPDFTMVCPREIKDKYGKLFDYKCDYYGVDYDC